MKVRIVKVLNKILGFINKVYHPKEKHTRTELDKELRRFGENTGGKRNDKR